MIKNIRETVREKYAKAITTKQGCCGGAGAGNSCCDFGSGKATRIVSDNLYSDREVAELPPDMISSSFGCGNPTALAELYAGEVVLDLGSGAGLDVLLSAKRVGPHGKAYGLDMTDEMLAEARKNQQKSGIANAEFIKGHIENIPLSAASVDVVISNCVINLSSDKEKVLQECFRVLKPGGRFAVADIVLTKDLPIRLQQDITAWAGCIAGALPKDEYLHKLAAVGFADVNMQITRVYNFAESDSEFFTQLSSDELEQLKGAIVSSFITARKPKKIANLGFNFDIGGATADDLSRINYLLTSAGLPTAGVDSDLGNFLVAKSKGGELLGVIGMETDGFYALLRSLAVDQSVRKQTIATALIMAELQNARRLGIHELYLMTETAAKYLQRFGFAEITRTEMPKTLLTKSALNSVCPLSSTCMKLVLT